MYIQQDAMLHNSFYVETALHVSGGTTHHQEHKQLYLQHLVFVTPLLLPNILIYVQLVAQVTEFKLTIALHVSGVTITHLQENKTTVNYSIW